MKEQIDVAKSFFELSKQILIAGVLVLLLFYPGAIGGALDKMGVTEGDIWGLKWKKQLNKNDEVLQTSEQVKRDLEAQLQKANDTIKQQSDIIVTLQNRPAGAPAQSPPQVATVVDAAKKLVDQNETTLKAAQQSTQAVQQTIVSNSQLISRAQESEGLQASRWVILTGSDTTEDAARDELKRARDAGFIGATLIRARGVYRTGIIHSDRQVAAEALPNVKARTRPDAYIQSMEKLCPNPRQTKPDLIEC